jgi:GTP-binding protein Era
VAAEEVRSGFVAVAGRPNVGKSTLVNRLVGDHVAAVSDKPQTTRRRTIGVVDSDDYQLGLLDLPGFQKPFDRLTERMQRTVDETLTDADVVLLVLNVLEAVGPGDRYIAARAFAAGAPPAVIAVNKVDRADPARIAATIAAAAELGPFHALHPVSALTGDGVGALLCDLVDLLPRGPRLYPRGVTSDQSVEHRIGELVREEALAHLRDEVPHAVAVEVLEVAPGERGRTLVEAVILCETASQKGILIGRHGAMIRRIGAGARPAIETLVGGPVYLDLRVKVRPRWRRDTAALDRLGV